LVGQLCLDTDAPEVPQRREEGCMFGFRRLDAYRAATEFLGVTWKLVVTISKGHGDIVDQLRRAALSVPLNIPEGSGKIQPGRRALLHDSPWLGTRARSHPRRVGDDERLRRGQLEGSARSARAHRFDADGAHQTVGGPGTRQRLRQRL